MTIDWYGKSIKINVLKLSEYRFLLIITDYHWLILIFIDYEICYLFSTKRKGSWQKNNTILGFHVTSEKTEIRNFKILPLSGESYF